MENKREVIKMSDIFDEFKRFEAEALDGGSLENDGLEGKSMYVPELDGEYTVFGDPYELSGRLDDNQGDNDLHAGGDCGLVSIANLLTTAGLEVNEDDMVNYAVNHNLCSYSRFSFPSNRGGTNTLEQTAILSNLGIQTSSHFAYTPEGSIDAVAKYIEDGRGVILGVNSGYLWDNPAYVGSGNVDHSVFATGTVRDPLSGELKGIIVCDSGRGGMGDSGSDFISVERLRDAYSSARGADVIYTDKPIR